jgi:tellurite resistance protein TerC
LSYGLALVLVFIGTKMLIIDYYKIPIGIALAVTATLIASSMLISVWSSRNSVENHTEK